MNPFKYGNIVSGAYFYDREDELLRIKQTSLTYDLGAVSSTQKALKSFINQGIIERINNKYEFSDPIYSMFLSTYL